MDSGNVTGARENVRGHRHIQEEVNEQRIRGVLEHIPHAAEHKLTLVSTVFKDTRHLKDWINVPFI